MGKNSRKGAIQFDELMYWIIGVVVLLLVAAWYFELGGKLILIMNEIKSFLRFG